MAKYNTKIKRLTNRNKKLTEIINELTSQNLKLKNENFGTATSQEYADMRLRAQKAELALEAIMQHNKDYQIKSNTDKFNIKTLIDKL